VLLIIGWKIGSTSSKRDAQWGAGNDHESYGLRVGGCKLQVAGRRLAFAFIRGDHERLALCVSARLVRHSQDGDGGRALKA
jgi:hypothetical protein